MAANGDFQAGDTVAVKGSPNTELNGLRGVLKKAVGSGKWAVAIKSLGDKSKIVGVQYLEKVEVFDGTSIAYSVVGAWDDWEPHAMAWDPIQERYEFSVVLGPQGTESFKILLDEDWDSCVYPDKTDANIYDGFELRGPDGEEEGGEWTIGKHDEDRGAPEACYNIVLMVDADGAPSKVTWEQVSGQRQSHNSKAHSQSQAAEEDPNARMAANAVSKRQAFWEEDCEQPVVRMQELPVVSRGGYGVTKKGLFSMWQSDMQEEGVKRRLMTEEREREVEVLEKEQAARDRLVRRLEAAQQAERLQIQDAEENGDRWKEGTAATRDDIEYRLKCNRERMDELEGLEAGSKKEFAEMQERLPYLYKKMEEQKLSNIYAKTPKSNLAKSGRQATCVECNQTTEVMTNGSCKECWAAWQALQKAGWNPDVDCDGAPAGLRSLQMQQASRDLSKLDCRRKVMEEYHLSFKALAA